MRVYAAVLNEFRKMGSVNESTEEAFSLTLTSGWLRSRVMLP